MSPCDAFGWERIGDRMVLPPCAGSYEAILWLFITPGDLIAYGLGVKGRNRDLVRMLVNGLFWIAVGGRWIGDLDIDRADLSMIGPVDAKPQAREKLFMRDQMTLLLIRAIERRDTLSHKGLIPKTTMRNHHSPYQPSTHLPHPPPLPPPSHFPTPSPPSPLSLSSWI